MSRGEKETAEGGHRAARGYRVAVQPRSIVRAACREGRRIAARLDTEVDLLRTRRGRADVAVFHEFTPSPSGGGHQFLRALVGELERRGVVVETNRISAGTPVCLFN